MTCFHLGSQSLFLRKNWKVQGEELPAMSDIEILDSDTPTISDGQEGQQNGLVCLVPRGLVMETLGAVNLALEQIEQLTGTELQMEKPEAIKEPLLQPQGLSLVPFEKTETIKEESPQPPNVSLGVEKTHGSKDGSPPKSPPSKRLGATPKSMSTKPVKSRDRNRKQKTGEKKRGKEKSDLKQTNKPKAKAKPKAAAKIRTDKKTKDDVLKKQLHSVSRLDCIVKINNERQIIT